MKLNLKYVDGKWVDFREDAQVKIRMLPMSKSLSMADGEVDLDAMSTIFTECVVDWKGFVDEDDKPIECSPENKLLMFDCFMELVGFVVEEQNNLREEFALSLKNSKTSVPGGSKKTRKTRTK